MKIQILETKTGKLQPAFIEKATFKDMPLKKDGWNFNWRQLFKIEDAEFYKVSLERTPKEVEGIFMFTLMFGEMVFMNNIEISPHNIGIKRKYDNVAGCLLAFCCWKSKIIGKGSYHGYVSFESKTQLISHYQNKYGAIQSMGHKMYFEPKVGDELIRKYLNQKL